MSLDTVSGTRGLTLRATARLDVVKLACPTP